MRIQNWESDPRTHDSQSSLSAGLTAMPTGVIGKLGGNEAGNSVPMGHVRIKLIYGRARETGHTQGIGCIRGALIVNDRVSRCRNPRRGPPIPKEERTMSLWKVITAVLALALAVVPFSALRSTSASDVASPLMTSNGILWSAQQTDAFPVCSVFLAPVQPGQIESQSDVACFQDSAARDGVSQADLGIASPARANGVCYTSGTIAFSYDGNNYSGARLVNWTSYQCWEPICSDGSYFQYSQVPGPANDRISSTQSFGGCNTVHYTGENWTGASERCSPDCPSLAINNQTSSVQFWPSYW